MFKKLSVSLIMATTLLCLFTGCSNSEEDTTDMDATVKVENTEPAEEEYCDEEFLVSFAEAVTYRQELGERVSFALTPTDVLEKELEKHPEYSDMNFKDDILKTYAIHYREALAEQLKYWRKTNKKEKNYEGYKQEEFSKAINAWLTQVDAVNAMVEEYKLPISEELAKEYKLERYFWSSGLYTPTYENYSNNTQILFEDMKVTSEFGEDGYSTIDLSLKNLTKHNLTGIHVYVYHSTKGGFVLEEEIPIDEWGIDTEVSKQYKVHEKYTSQDHVYDAGSGLPLTLFPNRIIYTK